MKKKLLAILCFIFTQSLISLSWTQTPTVVTINPFKSETNVVVNKILSITFDRKVTPRTLGFSPFGYIRIFENGQTTPIKEFWSHDSLFWQVNANTEEKIISTEVVLTNDSTTLSIDLADNFEEGRQYTVTIGNRTIYSSEGITTEYAFGGIDDWGFTTVSSVISPYVLAYFPALDAAATSLNPLCYLVFNEKIEMVGSGSVRIVSELGVTHTTLSIDQITRSVSKDSISFKPVTALSENTQYYVIIPNDMIRSITTRAYYNGILDTNQWHFKTLDLAPEVSFNPLAGTHGMSLYPSIDITFSKAAYFSDGRILEVSNAKELVKSFVASNGVALDTSDYDVSINSSATNMNVFVRNRLQSNVSYTLTLSKVKSANGTLQVNESQLTFTTATYNVWQGGISSEWRNSVNWQSGYNATANAMITDGAINYPVILDSVNINSLLMEPGARLTVDSGAMLTVTNFEMIANNNDRGQPSFINRGILNVGSVRIRQRISDNRLDYFFSSPLQQTTIVSATSLWQRIYDPYNWLRMDLSSELISGEGYVFRNITGTDLVLQGSSLNSENVEVRAIRTATNYGWHLAGNPFPSAIQWFDLQKSNLKNSFQIRLNQKLNYGIYDGDTGVGINLIEGEESLIPPMHAFYVQVATDHVEGSLLIPTTSRLHATVNYLKTAATNPNTLLKLVAKAGDYRDETAMVFNEKGALSFLGNDSEKLLSSSSLVLDLFSLTNNGTKVGIKILPKLDGTSFEIPLGFVAPYSGNFSIGITSMKNLPPMYQVMLDDNGTLVDLRAGDYEFVVSIKGINTTRFKLRLIPQPQTNQEDNMSDNNIRIYLTGGKIFAQGDDLEKCAYKLFDISGKLLKSGQADILFSEGIFLPLPGAYLLKIDCAGNMTTYKVLQRSF
ncbi:MAG: Ig-like domain-containing protein [Breznakibacter sp.]